jgi:hypothetical protein
MKTWKNTFFITLLIFAAATISGCKNPFSSEKKKELVRILVDDYLDDPGIWVFYWDGKDKNQKYVSPGKYILFLEVGQFQDQDFVNAESGGKPGKNIDEHYEAGFFSHFEIGQSYPDPFKVAEGVNIPIVVPESARIKLSIFRD